MADTVAEELYIDGVRRLAAGKVTSAMLELALDLDVFGKIGAEQVTLAELGERLEMPMPSTRMLAQFLCREGLLVLADGRFSVPPAAQKHLAGSTLHRKQIRTILKMAFQAGDLRQRLYSPPVLHWYQLRDQGEITDGSSMVGQKTEGWFASLQASNLKWGIQLGTDFASRYDFSQHRNLLDVGGGSGGWCIGIRKLHPHLSCTVLDLPEVEELARKSIGESGNEGGIDFVGGSFFDDSLPRGADVVLLANVLHDWTPEDNRVILRNIHNALPPGGTLLVKEYFFEDDWTGRIESVFEAFFLLGPEGKTGWQPSYGEMEELLRETGFEGMERQPDLIVCRKPG